MDIPTDVLDKAESLYWDREHKYNGLGCAEEAYEYVAEWARKEALREVADVLDRPAVVWWDHARGPLVCLDPEYLTKTPLTDWVRAIAEEAH